MVCFVMACQSNTIGAIDAKCCCYLSCITAKKMTIYYAKLFYFAYPMGGSSVFEFSFGKTMLHSEQNLQTFSQKRPSGINASSLKFVEFKVVVSSLKLFIPSFVIISCFFVF